MPELPEAFCNLCVITFKGSVFIWQRLHFRLSIINMTVLLVESHYCLLATANRYDLRCLLNDEIDCCFLKLVMREVQQFWKLSRRSFIAIVECRSHYFLLTAKIVRDWSQQLWQTLGRVADTCLESCVSANTTYTVSWQWLEASGVHVYVLQHEGLATAALMRTSGDTQGWRCSSFVGK